MEKFLHSLGIKKKGELKDGKYVIHCKDSDDFHDIFDTLDEKLIFDDDNSDFGLNGDKNLNYHLEYLSKDMNYKVELDANWNSDEYSLTCSKTKNSKGE